MHQFMPENLSDSVEIEMSNQSLNKGGAKIECHKCFSMKYGSLLHSDMQHTANNFIDGNCYTKMVNRLRGQLSMKF